MIESSDWDALKMKVSRNCVTKLLDHTQRGFRIIFSKIPSFSLLFYFFYIFFIFLDFRLLFHLFILVKKFWKLLWFFFVCMGDLSKMIMGKFHLLGLKKFWTEKLQISITFDREFGLRRFKDESFSKLRNEAPGPYPKGITNYFF